MDRDRIRKAEDLLEAALALADERQELGRKLQAITLRMDALLREARAELEGPSA